MLELYIFNKESPAKNGLSYWQEDSADLVKNNISFNLDRFKCKDNSQKILTELVQELTYLYKESENLKHFFDKLNGCSVDVELQDNYHHILCYDSSRDVLILDSKVQIKFVPLYLFALYYSYARRNRNEDEIFTSMFEFFLCFDFRALQTITQYLERDKSSTHNYDAGAHLYDYLSLVLKTKQDPVLHNPEEFSRSLQNRIYKNIENDPGFLATQLLRNRALAGKLPYSIKELEDCLNKHLSDPFGGDAILDLYKTFQNSFDKDYAKLYYKHLCLSLRTIGLKIVAQRGSRVAHEQGPILIAAGNMDIDDDSVVALKKIRSHIIDNLTKVEELIFGHNPKNLFASSQEKQDDEISPILLNINTLLDNLIYFCDLKSLPQARFEKNIIDLRKSSKLLFDTVLEKIQKNKDNNRDQFWTNYETAKNLEKHLLGFYLELEDLMKSSPSTKKTAVIYIQRPSSRSGHFIPRIILGQKLYIETDTESQFYRLNAIPYNFVSPDFDLVANGLDSFFENASISIVTDRDSGKPYIKWENAEDLALTLAPGMYRAIKSAQEQGKRFHYQLETTLFGPLIELFVTLLETEMNNIASIERHSIFAHSGLKLDDIPELAGVETKNLELEAILAAYQEEILAASRLVFAYYLLEDQLEEYMLVEGVDKITASKDLALSLRDVQLDIARYCLFKRNDSEGFSGFLTWAEAEISKTQANPSAQGYKNLAQMISSKLQEKISTKDARDFVKRYIRYPEASARKEYLEQNPNLTKVTITASKDIKDADYYYDFTVAPSRIDFGKHVVASVTTLMGRMLGANDPEALQVGKEYIDLVSKADNNLFSSASEAGSVKVIENTCRAIQYAKAISFQGSFQQFNIDGMLARMTINARNTKAAGIHIMEYGTMASTGYCITKEPLFILLGLAIESSSLMDKLGIDKQADRDALNIVFNKLLARKPEFKSSTEWELFCYEELILSPVIQEHLSDPHYRWLPSLKSMTALLKHIASSNDGDAVMARSYSTLASKLIEFSRIINETGIIQRTQIMNNAIARAQLVIGTSKAYSHLRIGLNAAYKGNVSDERENANQYLIALLLQQRQYIKNASIPEVEALLEHQCQHYQIPQEIRIIDPLVDPDMFMGGELKSRAEALTQKLVTLKLDPPLTQEVTEASAISYGSDPGKWRILQKRLAKLDTQDQADIIAKLETLKADFKYLELYCKGFYKNPLEGFQGLDVIQLNADHDEVIKCLENLVQLKKLMQVSNPESLLVLIDNPQQAKRPFFDYDKSLEWLALGGTLGSHMISSDIYEKWRKKTEDEADWARLIIQKQILEDKLGDSACEHPQYQEISGRANAIFLKAKEHADLTRDLVIQKYKEAQEMHASIKIQKRYHEWINCLARIQNYRDTNELEFADWLILGGRWVLNGQKQQDIDYIVNIFETRMQVKSLGKRGYELLRLFIKADETLPLESRERILEIAGSTKEADLLVGSAADNLEYRALLKNKSVFITSRNREIKEYNDRLNGSTDISDTSELEKLWDNFTSEYINLVQGKQEDKDSKLNKVLAKLICINDHYSKVFAHLAPEITQIAKDFGNTKEADHWTLIPIFGDHRKHGGIFQKLAEKINTSQSLSPSLDQLAKLGEMFSFNYLCMLSLACNDENEIINKLAMFFDQYLNIHEEDYPPYMFHSLCAGASYGFTQTYYLDPNLRTKMFKLACKTGVNIYKLLHHLISKQSVLKHSTQEYRDALIGDYENGIIAIGYQHETICIEERLWDCMRSLRNFVRNYHDKHPLPLIIKGTDATVDKLFRYKLKNDVELCWIAGLSNPGKHSWDLNCVLRSPLLREMPSQDPNSRAWYINISCFTPYLTSRGEIKQIYTSFKREIIEEQQINYLAPFAKDFKHALYRDQQEYGHQGSYICNEEGFVHAVVLLSDENLPKPDVTMSAHTHSQYINNFTRDLGVPETWSMLSMQQMYAKTEVPKILQEIGMESLAQIDFHQKEFTDKSELALALQDRLKSKDCDHVENWILKGSRDSGGRGISGVLSLHKNMSEILDFIFLKSRTDDVVMQEFVPNNARAFITPQFAEKVEDAFIDAGIEINRTTPYERIYFAMRSFQSIGGIKGYLFSANIGAATVNAGQGAKMFYGEPIYIMPIYIAGKIQKLMDEQGELILKQAIPLHAESFARANDIAITSNKLGSTNCYMFNGLFDYIPYLYVSREAKDGKIKNFKVTCKDNAVGGLDYSYNYYGESVTLISTSTHAEALTALEDLLKASANGELQGPETTVDIDLAKIEFNSGLGQANLLQRAIETTAPEKKDLFLEWTEDLGAIGMAAKVKSL